MKIRYNKFLKNVIHIANGTAIASGLNLINMSILVSAIGMKNNGAIFLAQSYVDFFNSLFNFQSYDAIIKFLPNYMNKDNEKCSNYIRLAMLLDIITAIFALIISLLVLDDFSKLLGWDNDVIYYSKILIATILFTVNGAFTGILRIYGKFKYMAISKSSGSIALFICYIIGYINHFSTTYYVLCMLLSKVIVFTIDFIMSYKTLNDENIQIFKFNNIDIDLEFIKFTIATNLRSTLDLPITHMVPFIINRYLGLEEIAVYKVLEKLGNTVSMAVGVINQVISPDISKKMSQNDIIGIKKIEKTFQITTLGFGITMLILIGFTYKMWMGLFITNYQHYMICVYLYFVYIIYKSLFMCQDPIFLYAGFVKYNIYILAIVNIMYIILLIFIIKSMGLSGLILSKIIQASCIFLLKGIILSKYFSKNMNFKNIA